MLTVWFIKASKDENTESIHLLQVNLHLFCVDLKGSRVVLLDRAVFFRFAFFRWSLTETVLVRFIPFFDVEAGAFTNPISVGSFLTV